MLPLFRYRISAIWKAFLYPCYVRDGAGYNECRWVLRKKIQMALRPPLSRKGSLSSPGKSQVWQPTIMIHIIISATFSPSSIFLNLCWCGLHAHSPLCKNSSAPWITPGDAYNLLILCAVLRLPKNQGRSKCEHFSRIKSSQKWVL